MIERTRFVWIASLVLMGLFWAITVAPILRSTDQLGIWDWDHHFASAELERQAVVDYQVLPLWNPYVAGGLPVLQHPLSSIFCPDFWLVILLGVPFGFKLLLAFRLAVGLAGGFALGRAFNLEPPVAAFFSVLASGSGAYTAHIVLGHAEWSLLAYVPWILLALFRTLEGGSRIWTWGCVAAGGAALLYLGGNIYFLFALGFLWTGVLVVEFARQRRLAVLVRGLAPFLMAGALSGAKLLPSWELFSEHPRQARVFNPLFFPEPSKGLGELPKAFHYIFLERSVAWPEEPAAFSHRPLRDYNRKEFKARRPLVQFANYSAYLGVLPLLFLPFFFASREPRARGLAVGGGILLLLVLSGTLYRSVGVGPWQLLRDLPLLGTLRNTGRFLAIGVTALALLSALGLSEALRRLPRWLPSWLPISAATLALIVLLATVADHGLRNRSILARAFPFPLPDTTMAEYFVTRLLPAYGVDYLSVRTRQAATAGHSNLFLPTGALPVGHPDYRGEAFLAGRSGEARVIEVRPDSVEIEVNARRADTLVVNQNYLSGWRRVDESGSVSSASDRLATAVVPEDRKVRFEYRPRLLVPALWLSAASLLGCVILVIRDNVAPPYGRRHAAEKPRLAARLLSRRRIAK